METFLPTYDEIVVKYVSFYMEESHHLIEPLRQHFAMPTDSCK